VSELDQISNMLQRKVGQRDQLHSQHTRLQAELDRLTTEQEDLTKALEAIQVVARLTQQELEVHVSELVTLALDAVFPRPYKLVLEFVLRRNRSEADLLLVDEKGNKVNPMDAVGGGVVDIAAFALRVALWSLKRPKPRAVMIMDEPFRFLSRDLQGKASMMLREISDKLGIQFLIVSHEENLLEAADHVLTVENHRGISSVK